MTFWKNLCLFMKKNWSYLLLSLGSLLAFLFVKKQRSDFEDEKDKLRSDFEKEREREDAARKKERAAYDAALAKLERDLAEIQRQYDEQKRELDEKKKAEIKDILEKYQDDPDALAQKLSSVTGFKVVLPE